MISCLANIVKGDTLFYSQECGNGVIIALGYPHPWQLGSDMIVVLAEKIGYPSGPEKHIISSNARECWLSKIEKADK